MDKRGGADSDIESGRANVVQRLPVSSSEAAFSAVDVYLQEWGVMIVQRVDLKDGEEEQRVQLERQLEKIASQDLEDGGMNIV